VLPFREFDGMIPELLLVRSNV